MWSGSGSCRCLPGAVPGFSVEEHTAADHWRTGDRYDPLGVAQEPPGRQASALREVLRREGGVHRPGLVPGVCQLAAQRLRL